MVLQSWELTKPIKTGHGRFVDYECLRQFFKSFAPGEDKYRLYYWTKLETGARDKECCAIQEGDYSQNYQKLLIITCKDPKPRLVTLSPFLAAFTKRWCEFNRRRFMYDYVFPVPSRKYCRMYPVHARLFLSKKRKLLKMKPIRTVKTLQPVGYAKQKEINYYALGNHAFRRFYETHMTDLANGNYLLVAKIMGYSDPEQVLTYYDEFQAVKREEQLAQEYHSRLVAGLLNDRPLLPRAQKTLRVHQGEEDQKDMWAGIGKRE